MGYKPLFGYRDVGLAPGVLLARSLIVALVGILVAGCGTSSTGQSRDYLDPDAGRPATIRSLDRSLCNDHLSKAADFDYYWVGICRDRTIFEKPVYFQVFTTMRGKRVWLRRYEACVPGRYVQGPRWIGLAVQASDERILLRAGAAHLACTNTRLPPTATPED